ncbi:MAG TPA: DNA-processing protein DprA [Solirubrobacteraceae bacterium]|nr:DNA-processing protein DprA [Solirubrobacteraceae bacterium]
MSACDACLRRTALVAALAAQLDVEWRRRDAPAAVLSLPDEALLALDRTGRIARGHERFSAGPARAAIAAAGLTAACRCDASYPEALRELADPPAVLHVAGGVAALAAGDGIALVGARRGTPYGLEVARSLGRGLSAAGVPVVSGLALGVDSAAHVGALLAPGGPRPVAVLAGGADIPYPASRRRLYREVAGRGAVVSELPPGFRPYRWSFVARNRLIAGLAAATVVVEATERSGSLTTADFAEQLGRPVGAVPGPVTSRFSSGTNTLLAAGAAVIRDAPDALDLVAAPAAPILPAPPPPVPLEPRLRRLLDAIERGGGSLAELATDPEATRQVLADLTELELRGLVRRGFGGRYVRAAGEPW